MTKKKSATTREWLRRAVGVGAGQQISSSSAADNSTEVIDTKINGSGVTSKGDGVKQRKAKEPKTEKGTRDWEVVCGWGGRCLAEG